LFVVHHEFSRTPFCNLVADWQPEQSSTGEREAVEHPRSSNAEKIMMVRRRLDLLMVERGLAPTRSRARDLIVRGCVTVAGAPAGKPGQEVGEEVLIEVAAQAGRLVSRGGLKLAAALDHFRFPVEGRTVLDIGASTGGFTQVLLEAGAQRIYAVDVGHGQLDEGLRRDSRVVSLESRDARSLTAADVPNPVDAIVADVSFISLIKALPVPLSFAAPGAWLAALVKPQFEAGPKAVGKGGIVRSAVERRRAVAAVRDWVAGQPGWHVLGVIESPVQGGSGNLEYLLGAKKK
jgi:23S rRNA (cytidine1920-2'-O)/16S rRNA (cytidine1409-2'-O)-methyltransferase